MDGSHFDALTRFLTIAGSRRRALGGLFVGVLALIGEYRAVDAAAIKSIKQCKKIKAKKKRKKCINRANQNGANQSTQPVCTPSCSGGGSCQAGGVCVCPSGTKECSSGICAPCCADSDCSGFCVDAACAPCPRCYVLTGGLCKRTQEPMHGRCPCGFEEALGQCMKDQCRDCFQNVGGICVPEAPGTAPNGACQCGFTNVGGICVPRYPLP
jgi:hypothetical protein